MNPHRSRILYGLSTLLIVCLGLLSRSKWSPLPRFLDAYAGDMLWATMVFLLTGFLFPGMITRRVALYAAAFSFLIELSQLYHAPWLDALRHTRLGALALGQGFLWSDLACYAAGVLAGAGLDLILLRFSRRTLN